MTNLSNRVIGIMGEGHLHRTLQAHLERIYQTVSITAESSARQISSCTLLISCYDVWSPGVLQVLNHQCTQLGIAYLPVYTYFGLGIIGPCVLPHEAGCVACAERRKLGAMWDDSEHEFYLQHADTADALAVHQPWLTSWQQEVLAQLVIEEIETHSRTPMQLRTRQAILCLALDTLRSSLHPFLPIPDCNVCGYKQEDTPEQATIVLQSRIKPGPFSYHVRDLASQETFLTTYVDTFTGVVSNIVSQKYSTQPVSFSFSKASDRQQRVQITSMGMAKRWDQSKVIAIAEALERHAGQRPQQKQIAKRASYHQLDVAALDPTTLGLHSPEQYALPHYPLVPYHHDLVVNWVWGYSFQRQQPLLVPENCAYYGEIMYQSDSFVYEISNGCALGSNLEEAILHGIAEVAERDAFLLTWYAQLVLPRLDLTSVTDPAIRLAIKNIEHTSGYTLLAFNATLDHALPCLWVMAVDELHRPNLPRCLCAAGSHLHPERALARALQELGASLLLPTNASAFEQEREHLLRMLHDPFKVQTMEDHSHLYWLPEAFERFGFLFSSARYQSFQEAFQNFYQQPSQCMDLRDDLRSLIDHYIQHAIDIVVVDQTTSEQRFHDLRCVKVLMPGTLSMTFGHAYRRTTGCQRLSQIPYVLGYRAQPLTEADINPHPHPFP